MSAHVKDISPFDKFPKVLPPRRSDLLVNSFDSFVYFFWQIALTIADEYESVVYD